MYKIEILKQCGCFTRRGMQGEYHYATREEADKKAQNLLTEMNEEFCGKHKFEIKIVDSTFQIIEVL